ncbi:hypothetical protein [uncultured Microbulbifer sp.]|uniref:hypothetical protein n=1 Tax=uncultured Microbulbifer sp. TaxID=348147 RepID=UPI002626729E|nr:hypothetical protein [uncultured Microbulbifer sp.]
MNIADNDRVQFVDIEPRAKYTPNKCAYNAKDEAETVGGEVVFGRAIFLWDKVMFDLIGHAVVEKDRRYYCVTPSKMGDQKVLFVPDPSIRFDFDNPNSRLPSCEVAISKKPEVQKLLNVREDIRNIKIKYPVSSNGVLLSPADAQALSVLERQQTDLLSRVIYALHPLKAKCACGSAKQFKKCCRPHMQRVYG